MADTAATTLAAGRWYACMYVWTNACMCICTYAYTFADVLTDTHTIGVVGAVDHMSQERRFVSRRRKTRREAPDAARFLEDAAGKGGKGLGLCWCRTVSLGNRDKDES